MVLSFGEVLIDCLPSGDVIGGAPLNVVAHLSRLGVESALVSNIGGDPYGAKIQHFANDEHIDDFLQIDAKLPTGTVEVTLENGQPSYEIKRNTAWENIQHFAIEEAPEYIVYGSLAMISEQNREVFRHFSEACQGKSTFVCDINLRAPLYSIETIEFCLKRADILKINDEELEEFKDLFHFDDAIQGLANVFGIDKILVTKGKEGSTLYWSGEEINVDAGKIVEIEDTVGAGDAFTSIFIYSLIKGLPPKEALNRAKEFAAIICQTKGAIPTDKSVYEKFKA